MESYEVSIDYPSENIIVEANNEEAACEKALELASTEFNPGKECFAEASLL